MAPLLEKWGIEAEKERENLTLSGQLSESSTLTTERPKIGHEVSDKTI
jgi:hypothetical protein